MNIKISNKIIDLEGALIVPVFKDSSKNFLSRYPTEVKKFIEKRMQNDDYKAGFGKMIFTFLESKNLPEKVLIVGMGTPKKLNQTSARDIAGKIGKFVKNKKIAKLSVILFPEIEKYIEEFTEGLLMSQYSFGQFSAKKTAKLPKKLKTIVFVGSEKSTAATAVKKAETMSEAITFVRDLVNSPSNKVDADYIVAEAKKIAAENKYKMTVFGDQELKKRGWGGILAVNQGSKKEAKVVTMEYNGGAKNEKPFVFVGKGILFDSGGYNLKPQNNIETMHQDMAGGAAVLGIFKLLKKLKIKKNVVGIIPLAENLIGAHAYRPSDIINTLSGLTVEITNTDAEGRLVLGDGVFYAQKFNPEAIFTIATLTGAIMIALGDRYAGLMGNDKKLVGDVKQAGDEVDDLGWEMPLHRDFRKKINSEIADLKNADTGRLAGAQKGALFIERFVDGKKWCHIDIASTAFTNDPKDYEEKGATGAGLRMLIRFLENHPL
ncbi:MAG: leucyl aminopeptidase [Candidatus Gracilibacteria bacterium]|jgi:leucyl aminopeptidase